MRQLLLVSERRGGPWDWSKDLREQELFDEHAEFMDRLVDEGFLVLGGPLDERNVLLVVDSESNAAVTARFVPDPWIKNGMLTIIRHSSVDDPPGRETGDSTPAASRLAPAVVPAGPASTSIARQRNYRANSKAGLR